MNIRRGIRRWGLLLSAGLLAFVGGSEAFLRVRYGLGDRPLMMSDPQTEYRCAPSRQYRRLGHRINYNAFSMRSDPISPHKA